jgi:hypothetical protein
LVKLLRIGIGREKGIIEYLLPTVSKEEAILQKMIN